MKPYYERGGIVIYHADCREVLPTLAAGSVDLVLTDPPYGTGGWRRLEAGAGSNPSGALVTEAWDDGAVDWLALCRCPVLTFWPPARTWELLTAAREVGMDKHRCLYMRKRDPKPLPGGRMRWSVEPIWSLSSAGFVLMGGDDCIEVSTPRAGRDHDATGHPYQKPLDALTWLLAKTAATFTLDPFMGSGTTLVAAKMLGRRAIGIEAEERWCEVAARRLSQDVLPLFAEGAAS